MKHLSYSIFIASLGVSREHVTMLSRFNFTPHNFFRYLANDTQDENPFLSRRNVFENVSLMEMFGML